MVDIYGSKERDRLTGLIEASEKAKLGKRDAWNLPPVEKGWLRGHAVNVTQHEEAGEFGTLLVMDFELRADPKQPGIPVRMTAVYFTHRLMEGQLMDVPDPTPNIRPVTPEQIFFAGLRRAAEITAHYPGRRIMTQRRNFALAALAVGGPAVVLVGIVAVLHFVFHVLD